MCSTTCSNSAASFASPGTAPSPTPISNALSQRSTNITLPPLKDFRLPGGGKAAAACHLARTIVRRAERRTATLGDHEEVRGEVLRYLNRLSDLLFVFARILSREENGEEVLWSRDR